MRQLKITKQVTNRETASLDKYLHDIAKQEMVTAQEEVELTTEVVQIQKIRPMTLTFNESASEDQLKLRKMWLQSK